MSGEINAVGTKVQDGVAGEQRTRNYFIIDCWEVKLELQQTKLEALKAVLKMQAAVDDLVIPLTSTVGFAITFNDGTKDTVVLQDLSVDDWNFALPGRSDRNKFTLPMRANTFKILA